MPTSETFTYVSIELDYGGDNDCSWRVTSFPTQAAFEIRWVLQVFARRGSTRGEATVLKFVRAETHQICLRDFLKRLNSKARPQFLSILSHAL